MTSRNLPRLATLLVLGLQPFGHTTPPLVRLKEDGTYEMQPLVQVRV